MTAVEHAKAAVSLNEKAGDESPKVLVDAANLASLFLQLVTVLDEVIVAKTEEMTIHDESNMGDPVWRQRHKAELMADLKKYQEMRVKCG